MGRTEVAETRIHLNSQSAKGHRVTSSPGNANDKTQHSPKLNHQRETTQVKQINVADFAKLHVHASKPAEVQSTNTNVTDYQQRVNKIRFKGASNSVPNYNEKQENIKKTVAQNDALLTTAKQSIKRKDQGSIYVSKIEPKSPPQSSFLLPNGSSHRNQFMDYLGGSDTFPRISYGSPTPLNNVSEDESLGDITIMVPKLPHLDCHRSLSHSSTEVEHKSESPETAQHTEDEPIVIVTNEEGKSKEHDGWESGYSSITPRLSVDSRAHALTPMSGLAIPNEHRSLTPFSMITNSTYLDHSRPQSTFLEVPHLTADLHDSGAKKFLIDLRHPVHKLPAIYSRNDDREAVDEHRIDFTPLPLQSVRTSDGEISD